MAAQNSQGIQILLDAEKEASKIVQKSRQYRVQKLKDAKTEAQKEIEALKAQKEQEFNSFESNYVGSTDEAVLAVENQIQQKLQEIRLQFDQNREKVIQKMLQVVSTVQPTFHVNAIPKGTDIVSR
ncbi:V-type ATPase [Rozella allomycis CSF55]|uniref:V-type proton ATPase subunit G n=1 Tax=Rozella allomycis (strain CSF55) TaxID=988480 RepID=A0A075B0A4_ROZAC|nr:Vacuolar (H+)-ATPase G subunit domain-containing protein [Rozella allomycis CSF55]RKP16246.1 V-type ATPase [Rozella allomycis CSF55]|eukprot:EPZ36009.1 Vacuolar (H+)-ATPase G subunit domain-containing protein [Rozella allomycis CSF55]